MWLSNLIGVRCLNKILTIIVLNFVFWSGTPSAFAEQVNNPFLIQSPWAQSHRTTGMQAVTPFAGPANASGIKVQNQRFREILGKNLGTSPWLVLSAKKYRDRPNARSLWGASLKGAFKFVVDGEDFEYADHMDLAGIHSISWNLVGITGPDGDRYVVPQPRVRGGGKFLVLKDGAQAASPIRVFKEFELNERELIKACDPPKRWRLGYSGVSIMPLPTGQLAFTVKFRPRLLQTGEDKEYVAIADNGLNRVLACGYIDDEDISNQVSYELLDQNRTALYYPTSGGIVKLTYDRKQNQISRLWKKLIPFRERTGTTPTLVSVGNDKFVVTVDGKCAVTNVFRGTITCSNDTSPSKLYAIRRDTSDPQVYALDLPPYIETIENSPAAFGNQVVVTNYAGYTADTGRRGVASAIWNSAANEWQLLWQNRDVQISGVPTISSNSGLVYGTGTTSRSDRIIVLNGIDLMSGNLRLQVPVGRPGEAWDAGNNLVINDDESIMYSTPDGVLRVR